MTRMAKAEALRRLGRALNAIPQLKELDMESMKFKRWHRNAEAAIVDIFGSDTKHREEFSNIYFSPIVIMGGMSNSEYYEDYLAGLNAAQAALESIIDEIKEYWGDDDRTMESQFLLDDESVTSGANKIFVVHGHDEAARKTVARFLEKLGLEPIVLHEQANRGATIIEKFEDYADVGFAAVLLTPDDVGAPTGDKEAQALRARQNVVFEMGFFMGKLGRKKVAVLLKGDIEKPSDADGIVYIPLDAADGWRLSLVRELRAAGFDVDANRAL